MRARRPTHLVRALLVTTLLSTPLESQPAAEPAAGRAPTRSLLVHITAGPNDPTRAALGFAVARAAADEGHRVTVFLAGDGVQLIRDAVLSSLSGLGTGVLREQFDGFVAKGGRLLVSQGSAKARGVTDADLQGKPATFAGPPQLVKLALEHDRAIAY